MLRKLCGSRSTSASRGCIVPEPPTASPPTTAPVLALTPSQLDAAVLAPAADEEAVRPWPLPEYDGVFAVDECVWSLAVERT